MDQTANDNEPFFVQSGVLNRTYVLRKIVDMLVFNFFWPNEFPVGIQRPEGVVAMCFLASPEEIAYVHSGDYFHDKTGAAPEIFKTFLESYVYPDDAEHVRAIEEYFQADPGWLQDLFDMAQICADELSAGARGERSIGGSESSIFFESLGRMARGDKLESLFVERGGTTERLEHLRSYGILSMTVKEADIFADFTALKFPQSTDEIKESWNMIIKLMISDRLIWPYKEFHTAKIPEKEDIGYSLRGAFPFDFHCFSGKRLPPALRQFPLGSIPMQEAIDYRENLKKDPFFAEIARIRAEAAKADRISPPF